MLKERLRAWNVVTLATAALVASTVPSAAVAKDKDEFTAGIQISELLQVPSNLSSCQPSDPSAESAALGVITGSGLGSAIGAFTVESVDCVRSANPLPYFLPPFTFSSTTFKLTTADGDQIIATYGGTAELQPSGVLVLKGSFSFTGGTGKYSKVKGGGKLIGVENIATTPATGFVTLSGTISR
jgi:hypothetical protein